MLQHTDELNQAISPMTPGGTPPPRYINGRNLNPEYVQWCFESEGYTLLSTYTSPQKPLEFICPNGHHHRIEWQSWNRGRRCARCSYNRKITPDIIEKTFGDRGYKVLTDDLESIRWDSMISYRCPNGHEHEILWRNFSKGVGCPYCAHQYRVQQECKKLFNELKPQGYELLKGYIKSNIRIIYRDPDGDVKSCYWRSIKPRLQRLLKKIGNDGK